MGWATTQKLREILLANESATNSPPETPDTPATIETDQRDGTEHDFFKKKALGK
jgi:hypothetical protein